LHSDIVQPKREKIVVTNQQLCNAPGYSVRKKMLYTALVTNKENNQEKFMETIIIVFIYKTFLK
jgi:hypothetical protein